MSESEERRGQANDDDTEWPTADALSEAASWRDSWVSALVKDPRQIPDTVVVAGFVGESPDREHLRLFADPSLRCCFDIPLESVRHREEIPRTYSPLGGSFLWVDVAGWPKIRAYQRRHQLSH